MYQTGETLFDNIMVATDGSHQAKTAFNLALQFFEFTNLFDKIIISHVSDKTKTYLPENWKPDHIYNEYKTDLLSLFPSNKYQLSFEEKRSDQDSCRDQILSMAQAMKVSFLFIGYCGRKGDKDNQTVLSQTVKHSAFHSTVPLVIIKKDIKRETQKIGGFTFLACVDGSQKSYKAMHQMLGLAHDPNDKILICYTATPDKVAYAKTIKAEVEDQLEGKTDKDYEFLVLDYYKSPSKTISRFVNTNEDYWINFVAIGNNGYRAMSEKSTFFGQTAESILIYTNANIIIVS